MKTFYSLVALGVSLAASAVLPAQTIFNPFPSRTIGQPKLEQINITEVAPNLVEGREFYIPQAVALDTSVTPHILYVADTLNSRVLVFANAGSLSKGDFANAVIGQRDFFSTSPNGPGSTFTTGLNQPVALLVDPKGNLYVADAGNNRVLRFPAPLQQTSNPVLPDLVIGQNDFNSRSANQGLSTPGNNTLALCCGSGNIALRSGLALDSAGNLWVSDAGNNRVLRFPAGTLTAGSAGPPADLVLGQASFTTNALPSGANQGGKNFLSQPAGLAFDPAGRLFVTDNASRVVVYTPPFAVTGQQASRLLGVVIRAQGQTSIPVSAGVLGSTTSGPPQGVFFVGNNPYVVDTGNNRIVIYPPYDQWPPESQSQISPPAIGVIGQGDLNSGQPNRGGVRSSEFGLSLPVTGVFDGADLYVADAGNNRVLIIPRASGGAFGAATRVVGQLDFEYNTLNLIEGRELNSPASAVVDTNSNPPHLYVADFGNSRVLGFNDARAVKPGSKADIVIGQPDGFTSVLNYPNGDLNHTGDATLAFPEGLAIDADGNLWVSDVGNSRVLRFPKPFEQSGGFHANLVLGQAAFSGAKITDATSQTMRFPVGIAFTQDGSVLVSDAQLNRVLLFRKPPNGDFGNGQSASAVFGEPDFSTVSTGTLNSPRMIATDNSDRLYVADASNHRLAIFPSVTTAPSGAAIALSINTGSTSGEGLQSPVGVAVDPATQNIWIADSGTRRVYLFPDYSQLLLANPGASTFLQSPAPVSVALDAFGNPVVTEGINRVAFYYHGLDFNRSGNAANYFARFSPGMIGSVFAQSGLQFSTDTAGYQGFPAPTTLGDVEVLVNGVQAPLFYASPGQINFLVPSGVPVNTQQEFQVVRVSTGDILGSWFFRIDPVSPGLFTNDGSGRGQVAALNQDNSRNGTSSPAHGGTVVQLFGTGQGVVSGGPEDGQPATGALPSASIPRVFIGGFEAQVQYSGLAPGFAGLWQINAVVPNSTAPGAAQVVITLNDYNSSLSPNNQRILTTIQVSQ